MNFEKFISEVKLNMEEILLKPHHLIVSKHRYEWIEKKYGKGIRRLLDLEIRTAPNLMFDEVLIVPEVKEWEKLFQSSHVNPTNQS